LQVDEDAEGIEPSRFHFSFTLSEYDGTQYASLSRASTVCKFQLLQQF